MPICVPVFSSAVISLPIRIWNFSRHYEVYVDVMRKSGQKDYQAIDYFRQHVKGIEANAKAGSFADGYAQTDMAMSTANTIVEFA